MLGKLLKYEWKSIGRILPLIYLAVLVLSVCLGISFRSSMYSEIGWGNVLFLSIYILLVMAMAVVTIVVVIEHFYRSMISQEGYLMHTLPVKSWQHIASKLIMAVIWIAIAVAVVLVSFLLIGAVSGLMADLRNDQIFLEALREMKDLFVSYHYQVVLLIICTVIQVIRIILQLYLAMAIGGSATKNKVAFSFLAFVVLAVIVSVISVIATMGSEMLGADGIVNLFTGTAAEGSISVDGIFDGVFVSQIIMDGVLAVVFFVLTNYFLKNRLNLQ